MQFMAFYTNAAIFWRLRTVWRSRRSQEQISSRQSSTNCDGSLWALTRSRHCWWSGKLSPDPMQIARTFWSGMNTTTKIMTTRSLWVYPAPVSTWVSGMVPKLQCETGFCAVGKQNSEAQFRPMSEASSCNWIPMTCGSSMAVMDATSAARRFLNYYKYEVLFLYNNLK